MRKTLKKIGSFFLIVWILIVVGTAVADDAIRLNAAMDRQTVYVFDRFTYQITVEGSARSLPEPQIRFSEGIKSLGSPTSSSQIQVVNGRWSSKRTYSYTLRAEKEGRITIPSAVVRYRGKVYKSNEITLNVIKMKSSGAQAADGESLNIPRSRMSDLFLWALVDNPNPYLGEGIAVTFNIFTRLKITDYAVQESPSYSGFWSEEIPLPKSPSVESKVVNGMQYSMATVHKVYLFPTVTGELVIDPLTMVFEFQGTKKDPFDSFFQSPFRSSMFNMNRQELRSSQAVTVNVRPLPPAGQPDNFTGAVGQFELETLLDKRSVQVGDAVVLKVLLSGSHNLETLPSPELPYIEAFKTFEPKSKDVDWHPNRSGWKQREYEYILVPHKAGDFEIPAIEYSYFNPKTVRYGKLETKPITLHVDRSAESDGERVFISSSNGEIERLGYELRYIKTNVRITPYRPPYYSAWFIVMLFSPFPIVPLIRKYARHRQLMMGDQAYARAFRARGESQQRFKSAEEAFAGGDYDAAVDEAAKALLGYLGNRLNLPVSGMTIDDVVDALHKRMVSEDVSNRIFKYWNDLDQTRFAPGIPSMETTQTFIRTGRELIDRLEREKLKKRRK